MTTVQEPLMRAPAATPAEVKRLLKLIKDLDGKKISTEEFQTGKGYHAKAFSDVMFTHFTSELQGVKHPNPMKREYIHRLTRTGEVSLRSK
ncbi:MAG: hypothetical protein M3Q63_01620 [bacterium]|nr:hypothetical protein [bacterium]